MKKSIRRFFIVLSLAIFCLPACLYGTGYAKESSKLFLLSPAASWYFPTSSKTKNAFGSTWDSFGVVLNLDAIGGSNLELGDLKLYPYFGYYHGSRGDNDAYIIPVGLDVRWNARESGVFRTYLGAGVSINGVKFNDTSANVDTGWRGAFGGRLMLGMDVTKWLHFEAAYNVMTEVKGYDFNGFSVQGTIRLYF